MPLVPEDTIRGLKYDLGIAKEGSAFDAGVLDPNSEQYKAAKAAKEAAAAKAKAEKEAKAAAKPDFGPPPTEAELRRRLDQRRTHLTGVRDDLGRELDVKTQAQILLAAAQVRLQDAQGAAQRARSQASAPQPGPRRVGHIRSTGRAWPTRSSGAGSPWLCSPPLEPPSRSCCAGCSRARQIPEPKRQTVAVHGKGESMKFIGAGARPGQPLVHRDAVFTVPNVLTVVRFLGVPLFIWLVLAEHKYGYGALVLAVMASTDWVDGYIARRFNQMSNLGRVMDPIADRLSLIAVAVTLVIAGVVEWWYLAALLVPDAVLLALSLFYFHGHPDLPVSRIGKIRTGPAAGGHAAAGALQTSGARRGRLAYGRVDLPGTGAGGALDCGLQLRLGHHRQGQAASGARRRLPLMVWLAVLLAVLGAFCLAFGAQRQGSAVKADTGGLALSTHGLLRLVRNPRWVFGLLLLCVGMANERGRPRHGALDGGAADRRDRPGHHHRGQHQGPGPEHEPGHRRGHLALRDRLGPVRGAGGQRDAGEPQRQLPPTS